MKTGIDVSENNGTVDWQAVKDYGIDFAMVRSSYGRHGIDSKFAENVQKAHEVGIKVGAYHYSYALTPMQAREEAVHCRTVIANTGCLLELPVFFDMEDADGYKRHHGFIFTNENITDCCRNFLEAINLNSGIYASYSWLNAYIDWRSLKCPVWNAQWGSVDDLKGYMWQFTDRLKIGNKCFDGNKMYL